MKRTKVKNAETIVAVHTHTGSFSKIKKEKGITLLALIVTIIVLIILAGISLSMISGDDGILSRTGNAKTQTSETNLDNGGSDTGVFFMGFYVGYNYYDGSFRAVLVP